MNFRTGRIAAAVVIVGAITGCGPWTGKHGAASAVRNSSQGSPQNVTENATGNAAQNSTSPSKTAKPSNSLQMYGAGTLTATKAIPWPGLQQNLPADSTVSNVIAVPLTAAVVTPTLSGPKTIETFLPEEMQGKLTAYFVQMDATTSFYVIGPSGMTGKEELAADGSFEVYLHNAHATIEVDTSGGSPITAASMAAPFFQEARTAMANAVPSSGWGPLAPASVTCPNPNTAYFSFATKSGQNVAGWNDYLPGTNLAAARMIYEADAADWVYAPYVLQAGVNLLSNVIAPQIGGTLIEPQGSAVQVGGYQVSLPHSSGVAVQTPKGVAWIWRPAQVKKVDSGPTNTVPIAPYGLAFATPQDGKVDANSAELKQVIPSVRVVDGDNDVDYAFPHGLSLASNRWLLYTVTWAALGMNQPASNDLHVYDMTTGKDTVITSFWSAGGLFFSMGTSGEYLAYDQSSPNAHGDFNHSVWLVNLKSGTKTKLPSSDLADRNAVANYVRATVGGRVLTIPLASQ